MKAVETINLTKSFGGPPVVDGLSFSVERGELFSLLGVNGAGKTTTIKMLTTLLRPTSGEAYIEGANVVNRPETVREFIAVSPQETAVARNLTVKENLEFMLAVNNISGQNTLTRIESILKALGLEEFKDARAGRLSGGIKRRLSIGMALITLPRVLFLDEPTLGLDVLARYDLWNILEGLKGKMTIIMTTHYLEEAQALSDRIGIMSSGRLAAIGTAGGIADRMGCAGLQEAFVKIAKEAQK